METFHQRFITCQTSEPVTILNDADIDGTLTLGSLSDVESSINTNSTNISSNDTDIASILQTLQRTLSISSNDTDIATNVTNIATTSALQLTSLILPLMHLLPTSINETTLANFSSGIEVFKNDRRNVAVVLS